MAQNGVRAGSVPLPSDCHPAPARGARSRAFVIGVALLVAIISLWRISLCLPHDGLLDHVSGVWLTLATDAAGGVLYRPLDSAMGYGGTRYFPLQFMLHGALVRAGMDPIGSGYLISLASTAALVVGAFFLLRQAGFSKGFSAAASMLTLATVPAQFAMTTIRGDMLPAALDVWGLVFAARLLSPGRRRRDAGFAGIFFALAFAVKATMLFGLAAAVLALLCKRRIKDVFMLAACWAGVAALILGAAWFLSDGRFAENFQKSALGGATWETFKDAPRTALACYGAGVAFMAIAFGVLLAGPWRTWTTLPALWLVITAAGTLLTFGSPGVSFNHLLDPLAAAVLATVILAGPAAEREPLIPSLLAVTALLCLFTAVSAFHARDQAPQRAQLQDLLSALPKSNRPMLAENNVIPIMNRERPALLDCFNFRVLALKEPAFAQRLRQNLLEHRFRAVILLKDPRTEAGKKWYEEDHFGAGFAATVMESYEFLLSKHGPGFDYLVFVPRTASAIVP